MTQIAYIALGSNLQNPIEQVTTAIQDLHDMQQLSVQAASSLYRSQSLLAGQPAYVNAVVRVKTQLTPHLLLQHLQKLEDQHGRDRGVERWGSRTLDCDLLLYDEVTINTPELIVPHAQLYQREFVLYPLAEIEPTLILPNGHSIIEWLQQIPLRGLEKICP